MTIEEFCKRHNACADGRKWALSTGLTTMHDLWQRKDMRPEWREWIATRDGVLTDRELRLYACWCVRQVWHLLTDERSRASVEVSERYSDGKATDEDLKAAREAAYAAAREAAYAASRSAAWEAAYAAARSAAWEAAYAASREAAYAASRSAAWEAAYAAAWEASREAAYAASRAAQSKWLVENTKPDFKNGAGENE